MNLKIIKAGILDTVQDRGRTGFSHLGINPGGAMDKQAADTANCLVANDMNEAVIEMHFPAAEILFEQPALIALSGGDFFATINGQPVPVLHPVLVNEYSMLQFNRSISGARTYLAIRGGIKISAWLSSFSTNLSVAAGGFHGRKLLRYDGLPYHPMQNASTYLKEQEFLVMSWFAAKDDEHMDKEPILVLPGKQWNDLPVSSKEIFLQNSFSISQQADRMGYHLLGEALLTTSHEELLSTAVNTGTIQLLPNGQLIVLMADHQSTGGYPVIAHVISAHHSRMAQMKPGQNIRFQFTDLQKAESLFFKQQQDLQQLQDACKLKLEEYFK